MTDEMKNMKYEELKQYLKKYDTLNEIQIKEVNERK